MGNTIKVPDLLRAWTNVHLRNCPCCGPDRQDKRYKGYIKGSSTHIYRASVTSVTMECQECGLQFCVTWRNFRRLLEYLYQKTKTKEYKKVYKNGLILVDYFTDSVYSTRKPPVKKGGIGSMILDK